MEATTITSQSAVDADIETGFGALPRAFIRSNITLEPHITPIFAPRTVTRAVKPRFVPRARNKFLIPLYSPLRLSSLPGASRALSSGIGGRTGSGEGVDLPINIYPVDTPRPGNEPQFSGLGEFTMPNPAVPYNLPTIYPTGSVAPPVPVPLPIVSINQRTGAVEVTRAGEPGVLQTVAGLIRDGLQTVTAFRQTQIPQGYYPQTYDTQQLPNGQYFVPPGAAGIGTIDGTIASISNTIASNPLLFGAGLLGVFLLFRDPPGKRR